MTTDISPLDTTEEGSSDGFVERISAHYPRWLAAQLVRASEEPEECRLSAIDGVIRRARVIAPALFRSE